MLTANMPTRDHFVDRGRLSEYLATQLSRGRLSLVLGAGVSVRFGLPEWTELVTRMFHNAGERQRFGHSPAEQIEYLRHKRYEHDDAGYLSAVHAGLYEEVEVTFARLREHPTLAAIGSLAMTSRRGSASDIITFNFDNIVELFLGYHGFVAESMFDDAHWAGYADATIYHPHGFIPFDAKAPRSHLVVFDQQTYSRVLGQEGNPWRQLVLTLLRRHTWVFIGLSGRDVNLDSILEACRDKHVSRRENTPFWGVTFSDKDDDVARRRWESRGVFYMKVRNYDLDLPDFLFGICQAAARFLTS